jgi:cysteinyl-tRNA synthetase
MTSRERAEARHSIGRMSTRNLEAREVSLLATLGEDSTEIEIEDAWAEVDIIRDELAGRRWALEDPSSGADFGHQPT